MEDVIEKIQKITKQKSLRISEFMRDYDPLRSGSITSSQFLSSLSMLKVYLSQKEAKMLIEKYANPDKEGEVLWTKFADDIDVVFVVKHLEKREVRFPQVSLLRCLRALFDVSQHGHRIHSALSYQVFIFQGSISINIITKIFIFVKYFFIMRVTFVFIYYTDCK